jgi:hypothetical protein
MWLDYDKLSEDEQKRKDFLLDKMQDTVLSDSEVMELRELMGLLDDGCAGNGLPHEYVDCY